MRDFVGVFGFCVMSAGLTARYGWDVACIIGGAILLTTAILGAMRK